MKFPLGGRVLEKCIPDQRDLFSDVFFCGIYFPSSGISLGGIHDERTKPYRSPYDASRAVDVEIADGGYRTNLPQLLF